MKKKVRRQHTEEFKKEAVRLAQSCGKPIAQVARDLRVTDGLLHAWIGKHKEAESKGVSAEDLKREKEEMMRLRREPPVFSSLNSMLLTYHGVVIPRIFSYNFVSSIAINYQTHYN